MTGSHRTSRVSPYRFFCAMSVTLFVLLFAGARACFPELANWLHYALAINLTAVLVTVFDKSTARSSLASSRVPELVLYGIAAAGGALGVLLAMRVVRHKTQKARFQFFLALVIVAQIALF